MQLLRAKEQQLTEQLAARDEQAALLRSKLRAQSDDGKHQDVQASPEAAHGYLWLPTTSYQTLLLTTPADATVYSVRKCMTGYSLLNRLAPTTLAYPIATTNHNLTQYDCVLWFSVARDYLLC